MAVSQIDPNADRCPWCGAISVRRWKGRHAAAQHPEEWEAFKNYYERENQSSTEWVEADGNN